MKRSYKLISILFFSFIVGLSLSSTNTFSTNSNGLIIPFLTEMPALDGNITDWADEGLNDSYYTVLLFDYSNRSLQGSFSLGIAGGSLYIAMAIEDPNPVGYEDKNSDSDFCDTLYLYFDTDNSGSWTENSDDVKILELSKTQTVNVADGYFKDGSFANEEANIDFSAAVTYTNQHWYVEIAIFFNSTDTGDLILNGGDTILMTVDFRDAIDPTIAEIDNGFDVNVGLGIYETGLYIGFLDKAFETQQSNVKMTLVRTYSPMTVKSGDEINITYNLGSNTPELLTAVKVTEFLPETLTNIKVYGVSYTFYNETNGTRIEMNLSELKPGELVTFSINATISVEDNNDIIIPAMVFTCVNPYGDEVTITIGSELLITISSQETTTSSPLSNNGTKTREGWYWYLIGAAGIVMIFLGLIFYFGRPKK